MAQVKDWILTKCREAPGVLQQEASPFTKFQGVVVTPNNIPAFTIPLQRPSDKQSEGESDVSLSSGSLPGSAHTSPRHSSCTNNSTLQPPHVCYAKSAPVSPSPTWAGAKITPDSVSYNDIDKYKDTNVDPQSISSLGLTHFKTRTSFGFDTLVEAPHTRRKESLYFDEECTFQLNRLASRSLQNCKTSPASSESPRRCVPAMVAPLGVLSTQQMTMDYDSTAMYTSSSSTTPETRHRNVRYTRRRSSYSGDCDNDSSPDMSPLPHRRLSGSLMLNKGNLNTLINKLNKHEQFMRSSSLDCPKPPLGELKISIQYVPESRQLKVILLKADNLDISESNCNIYAKLYLSPGKLQKHTSSCLKNTFQFNERFIFRNLDFNQLRRMNLHVKIFSREGTLSRRGLGQLQVVLSGLPLLNENRMWKCLDPCSHATQTLGHVTVSACFEASAQKLSLEILEACDLQRGHLRGAPDPYIRVELVQPGRPAWKSQTKVRRGTTTPVFSEEFIIDISPKIEDLNLTYLTVTVYDRVHLRNDLCIGGVRLGFGATEQSEIIHWNQVLQNPGKAFIESHSLRHM